MNPKEVLQIFKDAGALLEGHFLLSSGLHSGQYLQCARVLENPRNAEKLCRALSENLAKDRYSAVIGPALGGIIVSYELARVLGCRALFAEREEDKMRLRRGFTLSPTDNVIVAEDVITTGGSVKEVIELAQAEGAKVACVCALVDRSQEGIDFGLRFFSLLRLKIKNFPPQDCPLCKGNLPLVKPGSRK